MVKLEDMEQKLQSLRNLDGRSICISTFQMRFSSMEADGPTNLL